MRFDRPRWDALEHGHMLRVVVEQHQTAAPSRYCFYPQSQSVQGVEAERVVQVEQRAILGQQVDGVTADHGAVRMTAHVGTGPCRRVRIDLDPDHAVLRIVRGPVRQDPSTTASDVDEYVVGADPTREDPAERDMVAVLMVVRRSSWPPPRSHERSPTADVDKRIARAAAQVDRRLQPLCLSAPSHNAT